MSERQKSLGPNYAKPKQVSKLTREGIACPSEVLREDAILLTSSLGREEIRRARIKAQEIKRETGRTPELIGAHIANIVRKAAAANKLGGLKEAAEIVYEAREFLYAQMAESATVSPTSPPTLGKNEEQRLTLKAETKLAKNARLLGDTAASGLAGDKTLSSRGFDVHPQGGEELPPQRSFPEE